MEDHNEDYQNLKLQMKEFYGTNSFPLPISNELLYAAKLDTTQEWGRVQILSNVEIFYLCFFVDEGFSTYLQEEKLFLLDDRFKQLPPRSIKASLMSILDMHIQLFKFSNLLLLNLQISVELTGLQKASTTSKVCLAEDIRPILLMW